MQVRAVWMRGGTSKCWVFENAALSGTGLTVDQVLLRAFGSPDTRQLDGVGGGTSTTSKAVIVSRSERPDVDVDFTFAQVGIEEAKVDWGSNCGNCSATVGLYAIEQGWVDATHPRTRVNVFNENTNQLIVETISTPGGQLPAQPDDMMIGTPFGGHKVLLGFRSPEGATTGALFPAGQRQSELQVEDSVVKVSMVDAGAPTILIPASELNLDPSSYGDWKTAVTGLLPQIENIRRHAAVAMGLAENPRVAARAIPKIGIVSDSPDQGADIQILMFSMGKPHPAIPITASIALTKAVLEPGTLAHVPAADPQRLRIRTPVGVIETHHEVTLSGTEVGVVRTARSIAEAELFVPEGDPSLITVGAV
ncbi:methylitaconate delta2-delta3-isomerase [Corynebacterium hylobatis]|uniref:Methylitaconate delta2-delta3-isomerase n=1 Tax=Corynebacterium hylobatis TaxID=1859290 RepID=A0A430I1M7_9CORY|nr:PrpF domain-containing protein [Corynebacterium hylobatis]RSZ65614.1 methylitaconate delta2-delta3-isomerase [Corynebacterium hylobatis]